MTNQEIEAKLATLIRNERRTTNTLRRRKGQSLHARASTDRYSGTREGVGRNGLLGKEGRGREAD